MGAHQVLGDRVRALPAEPRDEGGGREHRDRAQCVVAHLEERGADVQVLPAARGEQRETDGYLSAMRVATALKDPWKELQKKK